MLFLFFGILVISLFCFPQSNVFFLLFLMIESKCEHFSRLLSLTLACLACVLSHFSRVLTLSPQMQSSRLLCPWGSPGKNTGVDCHTLLQGIFPTQGSNGISCVSCIGRQVLYHWSHLGSPLLVFIHCYFAVVLTTVSVRLKCIYSDVTSNLCTSSMFLLVFLNHFICLLCH